VPLSPREERILAAIEDGLDGDHRLAAAFAAAQASRRRRLSAALGLPLAALVAALGLLVVVHAADLEQGPWGTAVLTLALLVPWTVWAARRTGTRISNTTDLTEETSQ
jgi:hypothetical protein